MEEFKTQLKDLKVKLKAAEKRAVIAEKMVKVFSKELDAREGTILPFLFIRFPAYHPHFSSFTAVFFVSIPDFLFREKEKYKYICDDMDSTFAELTGY